MTEEPCPHWWPWPDCTEARNMLGSLHLLCSTWHIWAEETRRVTERGEESCLPPTLILLDCCGFLSPLCPGSAWEQNLALVVFIWIYLFSLLLFLFPPLSLILTTWPSHHASSSPPFDLLTRNEKISRKQMRKRHQAKNPCKQDWTGNKILALAIFIWADPIFLELWPLRLFFLFSIHPGREDMPEAFLGCLSQPDNSSEWALISHLLIFSTLGGGQEVEDRMDGEKVRWLGWDRGEKNNNSTEN